MTYLGSFIIFESKGIFESYSLTNPGLDHENFYGPTNLIFSTNKFKIKDRESIEVMGFKEYNNQRQRMNFTWILMQTNG